MQMDRHIDLALQALDKGVCRFRQQEVGHVLDADRVRTHLDQLLCQLDEVVLIMNGADGITQRRLTDATVLLRITNRCFQVSRIVQRVKNTDDVNAVFNGLAAELLHHIVRIVLVAQNVLAAEEHLQFRIGQRLAQRSQTIPGIFIQKAQAGIEGGAAPDLQRPVADGVQNFAGGQHILDAHARGSQRLVRIAQNGIGNLKFGHGSTPSRMTLGEQREEHARGNCGTDHARHIGAHGMHEQEILRVFLLTNHLRHARSHRHG